MALFLFLVLLSSTFVGLGAWSLSRIRGQALPPAQAGREPSVSILKPLAGQDPDLERNLTGFFRQDYPSYELLFVMAPGDRELRSVVDRVRARFPLVQSRVLTVQASGSVNPKVASLKAAAAVARHDVLVVSDANVAVTAGYVREMVRALQRPRVGLVTSLFVGARGEGPAAALETLHLGGGVAAGVALPSQLCHPVAIGKSMAFRASDLARLGGFAAVEGHLAEDYLLGRLFHRAGYRVEISPTPVLNIIGPLRLGAFLQRHMRWGMIRIRLEPLAFWLEPLSIPLFVAALSPLFGQPLLVWLGWALIVSAARDFCHAKILGVPTSLPQILALGWLRDLFVLVAWAGVPFRHHVTWRGRRHRVGAGTRLRPWAIG